MKFQILNNEELGFFNDNGTKKATIKISGSNLVLNPSGSGDIILGDDDNVNDIEIGISSVPSSMTFLGGGTITSNGNTLNIGDPTNNDSVVLYNTTFSSSVTVANGLSGSFTGSHYGTYYGYGGNLTGVVATVSPGGSNKSIQFNDGNTDTSGSNNFTFDKTINAVSITGSLNISGSLNGNISGSIIADSFIGNGSGLTGVTSTFSPIGEVGSLQFKKSDTEVSGSGDVIYNITNNSLVLTGELSSSILTSANANLTGSFSGSFTGDGSQLTNISGIFPDIISLGNVSASGNISGSSLHIDGTTKNIIKSSQGFRIVGALGGSGEDVRYLDTINNTLQWRTNNDSIFELRSQNGGADDVYIHLEHADAPLTHVSIGTNQSLGSFIIARDEGFATNNDFTITGSSGYIGINEPNPTERLSINGNVSASIYYGDEFILGTNNYKFNKSSFYIGTDNQGGGHSNGVSASFEFRTKAQETYDSTLHIRPAGNPGGFGLNQGLYLRSNGYNTTVGTAGYMPLLFKSGMSPSGAGTIRGGYTYSGKFAWGATPDENASKYFTIHSTSEFKNGLTVTGSLTVTNDLVIQDDINFTGLPTTDPGVAGRLFQTGSDAIGATAGFQVVLISQG